MLSSSFVFSEIDCDIDIDSDIPVCPGGMYTLSVPFCDNCIYTWTENGFDIEGDGNELTVVIETETTFGVTVKDTITSED